MSDWTWEYVPDAASVVGGLARAQIDQVEGLAARIADAVAVRRIGTPFDAAEAVSYVKSYGEGPVMIWFLEDYRDDVVLVVRVQHFELSDPGLWHGPRLLARQWRRYVSGGVLALVIQAVPGGACCGLVQVSALTYCTTMTTFPPGCP
jgi:hypothetical protein